MDSTVTGRQALGASPGSGGPRERPALALFFLLRLDRLVMLRSMPALTAERRKLVDHALYSTYWDCVRAGLRAEARLMLGLPAGAGSRKRGAP